MLKTAREQAALSHLKGLQSLRQLHPRKFPPFFEASRPGGGRQQHLVWVGIDPWTGRAWVTFDAISPEPAFGACLPYRRTARGVV